MYAGHVTCCTPVSHSGYVDGTDRVKGLSPTRRKTDHFGDVLPGQSLVLVLKN